MLSSPAYVLDHASSPAKKGRILCLHGKGTNADIFASQTRSIRQRLQEHCEFVFVNGLLPSEPYPGTDQFYSGPYYSWYEPDSMESLVMAERKVRQLVDELGPFDGIMGFSQGGALAAFACMVDASTTLPQWPKFKLAILMCCGLPIGVEHMALQHTLREDKLALLRRSSLSADFHSSVESLDSCSTPSTSSRHTSLDGSVTPSSRTTGSPSSSRDSTPSHPDLACLLTIPTAHIMGRHDAILAKSNALYDLCHPITRHKYEHIAGHLLPRTNLATLGIADVILQTVKQTSDKKKQTDEFTLSHPEYGTVF